MESVYIHIPFCKKICNYCDFCKMYYNDEYISLYLEALKQEIITTYQKEIIKTLYIGGGTPSCIGTNNLKKLFEIIKIFKLNQSYEFTFECNIEDINEELLILLKNNKVNRISIGVQSFNKKTLNILGRNYQFNIDEKIILCKKYFQNINIDLIYGVNTQTIKDLNEDLDKFLSFNLPHISIYSLILEDNTILKINNYQEINEDLNADMYELITKRLKENNYNHYEISNFSKENYQSQHNLNYWNNKQYYGFGLGASGYIKNTRYTNTRSINKYINKEYIKEQELINNKLDMQYFMILGLRKIKGISNNEFLKRYNCNIKDIFDISMLTKEEDYYYINEKDLYISNNILMNFID